MRLIIKLSGVALAVSVSGCITAAVESGNIAHDKAKISNNIDAAEKGDPEAQFKVGEAYCCNVDETSESGAYNTRLAVGWLCASAVQGYAPAMYKIGKIYSGDVIDGIRLGRRVAQGAAGTTENPPVAYAWLTQAKNRGIAEADERAIDVWKGMSPAQQAEATRLTNQGLSATCRWEDAILAKRPAGS